MNPIGVARKDLLDSVRSRSFLVLTVIFSLFLALSVHSVLSIEEVGELLGGGGNPVDVVVLVLGNQMSWFTTGIVSIIGLMIAYSAISKEVESGSIRVMLSLPYSRLDVVMGKFLGRSVVTTLGIGIGCVIGLLLILFHGKLTGLSSYVYFVFLTALLGVVYIGIGVGVSGLMGSQKKAAGVVILIFVFLKFFWDTSIIPVLIHYLANGELEIQPDTWWYTYLELASPNTAYAELITASTNIATTTNNGFNGDAMYSLVVFGVWCVGFLTLGYLRFNSRDIS